MVQLSVDWLMTALSCYPMMQRLDLWAWMRSLLDWIISFHGVTMLNCSAVMHNCDSKHLQVLEKWEAKYKWHKKPNVCHYTSLQSPFIVHFESRCVNYNKDLQGILMAKMTKGALLLFFLQMLPMKSKFYIFQLLYCQHGDFTPQSAISAVQLTFKFTV